MSVNKFKSDSYCVGGRLRVKIYGDLTSESSKILIGKCSIFRRKKG